jgi:hypothetical protein
VSDSEEQLPDTKGGQEIKPFQWRRRS